MFGRLLRGQGIRHFSSPAKANFGLHVVPQKSAFVVERFGKFHTILKPGLRFLIPFVDQVAYIHSLKETTINIPNQQAITRDNVTIEIDGVLYVQIVSAEQASYGVNDVLFAVTQLAQTTMRSELGKITLDETFEEREHLNKKIVTHINNAAAVWGIECLRYEIRDISPPEAVRAAMDSQAEAERHKRARILESEGERASQINVAESEKRAKILEAEAEAESTLLRAEATASSLKILGNSMADVGMDGARLRVAEKYIEQFGNIAKEGNIVLMNGDMGDVGAMVAKATTVYSKVGHLFKGQDSAGNEGKASFPEISSVVPRENK